MPLVLRAMLLALFACWGLPAAALESAPATSPRATASLVSDVDTVAPGQAVPRRPAAAAGARVAHLLAEPWRRRRSSGAGSEPTARRHRRADRVAGTAARRRRVVDDLRLQRRGASAGYHHALRRGKHRHQGARELAGVPRHLRAGGGGLPARSARRERLTHRRRRRCSPHRTGRCRGRRPGTRWLGRTGRCSCRARS